MSATKNSSLSSLLNKSSLDDHEQLLAASEAALKVSKSDVQAQHVKFVALLKLDRYEDAVSYIESVGSDLKSKVTLEYAYALYKAGQFESAVKQASSLAGDRGAQHVEAQARYRLEDYTRTAELYKTLRETKISTEEQDLRINQGAIDAQGQWLGQIEPSAVRRPDRDDLAAFETAYNAACGSIARGELSQAEVLLKRAKTLCQHSDELTDKQKTEELLPILVQQIYVLQVQGKASEAEAISSEINIDHIPDVATRKIAANNLLLDPTTTSNPFVAHKAFNSTPRIPASEKLFSYQSIPLLSNEKTIDLKSLKFEGLARSTKQGLAKSPSASSSEALLLSVFNAAALAKQETGRGAINRVLPELQRRPGDIGLTMILAQMYTLIGDMTSATDLTKSLMQHLENSDDDNERDLRYQPGLVSMIISLYRVQGRKDSIRQELARAASYWAQKPQPPISLLRAAGISLLASSTSADAQIASEIFDKLYNERPDDKATVAGYVASHALSNPDSVKNMADKLRPVSELVSGIDVDALESAGIPQASNALAIAQAGTSRKRTAPSGAEVGRPKRSRKSRLPKGFDPAAETKPDPERWLPMRDRSYYRPPKGKKKGKKGDDRTQGGAVSEDLDVSKQPQKGGEVISGVGGTGGKKKKGKGKK